MRGLAKTAATLAMFAAAATTAQGYYHFVRYLSRVGPFQPIYEKFDLNALRNRTVPFLVSESGPSQYAPADNFVATLSQIRLAASAWNDVPTSSIRLAFGGLATPGAEYTQPMIEVVFDELAPGILGYGAPTSKGEVTNEAGNGPFVPIQKSVVILNRDMSRRPSWSESFHLTTVHEFGHALGLQHTFTSGVMSTEVTRGTTKARPLSTDDRVGLSLLYPAAGWNASRGVLTGRVTAAGQGMNLVSVVAISLDGNAVSTLTNPDGSYRVEGLPPGSYWIYAHPLPPALTGETFPGAITPPIGSDGQSLASSASFGTIIYPGVREPNDALSVAVGPGSVIEGIDFVVTPRARPAVYAVQTFSFPDRVAVKPAHITPGTSRSFIVASGVGLNANTAVSVLGGAAVIPSGGIRPYAQDNRFVQIDVQFNLASTEGTRHLAFRADNDTYVLPSAFRMVRASAPTISTVAVSIDATGQRYLTVTGGNFNRQTQILFDGVPAEIRTIEESFATVIPPPAPAGHRAVVVALNADGQSSLFLQGSAPPAFEFDGSVETASVAALSSQLIPGAEQMVEILGTGVNFSQSYTGLSFSHPGIQVQRVWVLSPERMIANVWVSPDAVAGPAAITLTNGLRLLHSPFAIQIGPRPARQFSLRGPVSDIENGLSAVAAGRIATVQVNGLPAGATVADVVVNDARATNITLSGATLTFRVPATAVPGPAVVRVTSSSEQSLPLVMVIDTPPPVVAGLFAGGSRIDGNRPARHGELVTVRLTGLAAHGAEVDASRLEVIVGQVRHAVAQVTPVNGNGHDAMFVMQSSVPAGTPPLVVTIDGRPSAAVLIPVRNGN